MTAVQELREQPTALYRWYAEGGRLLYVGISFNPVARASHHSQEPWWPLVRSGAVEWFDSRPAATEAERRAIWDEEPAFNTVGTGHWRLALPSVVTPTPNDTAGHNGSDGRPAEAMETTGIRLRRADLAAGYRIKPAAVTRAVSRGSLPRPDGYDARGAWWWSATLDAWTRPGRTGRPKKGTTT